MYVCCGLLRLTHKGLGARRGVAQPTKDYITKRSISRHSHTRANYVMALAPNLRKLGIVNPNNPNQLSETCYTKVVRVSTIHASTLQRNTTTKPFALTRVCPLSCRQKSAEGPGNALVAYGKNKPHYVTNCFPSQIYFSIGSLLARNRCLASLQL